MRAYLAVFDFPGHMRLAFFTLDFEECPLLVPGSELATPSEGQASEPGAGVLVFEVVDDGGALLLSVVH